MLHDDPSLFRLVFKADFIIVIRRYHENFNKYEKLQAIVRVLISSKAFL